MFNWDKFIFRLQYLPNEIGYYKFQDNWHNLPYLSQLLCKIGRHDYEALAVGKGKKSSKREVVLICMPCGHLKTSTVINCGK